MCSPHQDDVAALPPDPRVSNNRGSPRDSRTSTKIGNRGRCLARLVVRATHVLRLCSGPEFNIRDPPGPFAACHSPSLIVFPVTLFSCPVNKARKGQKKKKNGKLAKTHTNHLRPYQLGRPKVAQGGIRAHRGRHHSHVAAAAEVHCHSVGVKRVGLKT